MRRPAVLGAIAVGVLTAAFAIAVIVLANQDKGKIADGVRVAGVNVGGLTRSQAQARLSGTLLGRMHRSIVVNHDSRRFELGYRKAGIHAEVAKMVDAAMARSQGGNVLSRAWRHLRGSKVDADLPAQVTYSHEAVSRLVDQVERQLNRKPQDAKLSYTVDGLGEVNGKVGIAVKADTLQSQIEQALNDPAASRTFVAQTRHVAPKVTRAHLAKANPTVLVVSRTQFKLKLYKNLKLAKSYDIAVGMQGLETPAGLYHIQNKAVNPAWSVPYSAWTGSLAGKVIPGGAPNNPIKARWLGIFAGAGIHGVDPSEYGSIGHAASHGCVRMRIEDVIDLYPRVPVQTPIFIN